MINRAELLKRISLDPNVCFGKPCIRGTRIWVSLIVENLAEGVSEAEFLQAYPQLQPEDIRACWRSPRGDAGTTFALAYGIPSLAKARSDIQNHVYKIMWPTNLQAAAMDSVRMIL